MTTPFDNDDNIEEPLDEEELVEGEAAASSNRTFMLAVGVLGGIFLLTLLCIGAYSLWFRPRNEIARMTQAANDIALATQVAFAEQATEQAAKATPTRQATSTPTQGPTNTPVVALAVTATQTPLVGGPNLTQTVQALIAQSTAAAKTPIVTSTALPKTGFADDVGLPGLLGLAVVLVVVIFLTRRLRTAS